MALASGCAVTTTQFVPKLFSIDLEYANGLLLPLGISGACFAALLAGMLVLRGEKCVTKVPSIDRYVLAALAGIDLVTDSNLTFSIVASHGVVST